MKKTLPLFALAAIMILPTTVSAQAATTETAALAGGATTGKMLYAAGGKRLAIVNRVAADGSPQIIIDGKLVTVPAATLSLDGGKVTTSLSKADLLR